MSRLEPPPMSTPQATTDASPAGGVTAAAGAPAGAAETAAGVRVVTGRRRRAPGRFAKYFVEKGWAHLLLLVGVGIFLFPFVWMVGTSLKTDEELTSTGMFPGVPRFRPASPYARGEPAVERPADVPGRAWAERLPELRDLTRTAVEATDLPPLAAYLDRDALLDATVARLLGQLVVKLNTDLWTSDDADALVAAYRALLTPEAIVAAADDRIARLELRELTLRTNEAEISTLVRGRDIAGAWTIESGGGAAGAGAGADSGGAELVPVGDYTVLRYRFPTPSAEPVVLRYDFDFPVAFDDLHKLGLSVRMDDSWHRVDATLDVDGQRWATERPTYLAQHRPGTIFLQPPGFDDTTYKARTWIPLVKVDGEGSGVRVQGSGKAGSAPDATPSSSLNPEPSTLNPPRPATLRVILSPSSTARAIYGKVERNYSRAFNAVPFWTYVGNSLLLVGLTTAGALFSAAFVAYGFARLRWPGRSVAFGVLLATMMLPGQVTMIPSFMIWRQLGWYNTLNPLWVPAWFGGAFFVFLMVQHMKTIPMELEEAARLDGLNAVQTWWYIILPQVKPTLAAIAIMTFMGAWNEFMGPIIYLRDQAKFPLSVGLFALRLDQGGDWSMIMAGNVLMTLPVIVIFFLFQRYFIEGMTMSGMKG